MEKIEMQDMTVYSTFDLNNFFEVVKEVFHSEPYFAISSNYCDGEFIGYKCATSHKPLKWNSATSTFDTINE